MKKLGVGALALAIFAAGAAQKANATAVLIPYVKAGDGFVTAITYINRKAPGANNQVVVHFTYQLKDDVGNANVGCTSLDRPEPTSPNDVTTVLFDGNGPIDKPGLFGDTTGMGFTPIYQGEGFLVLENYEVNAFGQPVNGTAGDHHDLTAEAHVLHAATRGVFSIRAIELHHPRINDALPIAANFLFPINDPPENHTLAFDYDPANQRPKATGFHFLPGKLGDTDLAATSIYALAVSDNSPTGDLIVSNYNLGSNLRFIRTPDNNTHLDDLNGGYDRNERPLSFLDPGPFSCVARISIEDVTGLAWTAGDLVHTGGWAALTVEPGNNPVIPYKIEVLTDSPFGFAGSPSSTAITPLVPQIYAR